MRKYGVCRSDVRADVGGAICVALRIEARGARRASAGSDEHPVGAISALWLSRFAPALVSEHASWNAIGRTYLANLLPRRL